MKHIEIIKNKNQKITSDIRNYKCALVLLETTVFLLFNFFCVCCEYNEHCLTVGLRLNWIEFAEQRYRFAASGKTQISINSLQCLFYRKTNKNGLVVSVFDSHTNARIPKHTLYNSFSFDTEHCYRQSVSMAFACVLSVRLLLSFVRSFALIHSSQHHLSFVESLWSFFRLVAYVSFIHATWYTYQFLHKLHMRTRAQWVELRYIYSICSI